MEEDVTTLGNWERVTYVLEVIRRSISENQVHIQKDF
jgi:hypothetical protein